MRMKQERSGMEVSLCRCSRLEKIQYTTLFLLSWMFTSFVLLKYLHGINGLKFGYSSTPFNVFMLFAGHPSDPYSCPQTLNASSESQTSRIQSIIDCKNINKFPVWQVRLPASNTYIPSFRFGDPCLQDLITHRCKDSYIVPNIVHYIWFATSEMNIYHFLSFWSVNKFLKPCWILVHGNELPYGKYWEFLLLHVKNIIHVKRIAPNVVFGRALGPIEHKADVARIEAVKEYGGIYVDTDEIILRPFHHLRKYAFTMSHAFDYNLSNGVILSAKNATFLHHWYEAYRNYTSEIWGQFSTIIPYKLSQELPELIHVEGKVFVNPDWHHLRLLFEENYDWHNNYGIHLFIRKYKVEHNFEDIRTLNTTIGSVFRHVLYGVKHICHDKEDMPSSNNS